MVAAEELFLVPEPSALWAQVWRLSDAADEVEQSVYTEGGAALSDGTGVWWQAAQLEKRAGGGGEESGSSRGGSGDSEEGVGSEGGGGSGGSSSAVDELLAGLQSMPPAHLADEALAEWLHFFAGHKKPQEA